MGPDTVRRRLLAETDWLADHLADPSIRIVDIRGIIKPVDAPHPHYFGNRSAYLESHIPGAVFVDWTVDITEPGAPVKMTLAGPGRFAAIGSAKPGIANTWKSFAVKPSKAILNLLGSSPFPSGYWLRTRASPL